jgi:cell division protein FtsI/penicillin-binding protein 2
MRRSPQPARDRLRRVVGAGAATVLLAGGVAACGSSGPDDTVDAFLAGWRSGNLSKVGFVTADGSRIAANDVFDQLQSLAGDLAKMPLVLTREGKPKTTGDIASSTVKMSWTLPGGGAPWAYDSTVRMTKQGSDGWRVIWEPSIVNGELSAGDKLKVKRVAPERSTILDGAGQPLVTKQPVVTVGVSPEQITDLAALTKGLAAAFKKVPVSVDLSGLKAKVDGAPNPGAFLDLITLRDSDYQKITDGLHALDGTVFRKEDRDLAPTRAFARALLGTADQATKDDIDANPETVAVGDIVGHGGLQARYDTTLRGTAGRAVVIARTSPDDNVEETQIFSTKPAPGKPVKITLDVPAQKAADAAVAAEKHPSALVAIKISDSTVLAVANGPDGGTVNTAFTGQVPPGSTFKMVSAYGLLTKKKVTPATVVDCPRTKVVDGRTFKNAENEALGKVPFHTDFAESCNTAFVGLAPALGADGLQSASAALGLGGQWDLGIDAFTGKVSAGDSPTELAAAAFGQGTTVVSPLAMAAATAAVARGQFKQPKLVLEPAPPSAAPDGAKLDAASLASLRSMMREVVTRGTGTGLRTVPGGPVSGKTGTAEFDTGSKDTHAWFVGWQGDIAFAVMVQKGGAGADAAVPIVDRFLTALNKR